MQSLRPIFYASLLFFLFLYQAEAYGSCSGNSPNWFSTVDYNSLSACIAQALTGDTITISSGTATYNSPLLINKSLKLIGSGPTSTIITGNNATVIAVNMPTAGPLRISNIGFTGAGGPIQLETALINLRGVLTQVRMDHLNFTNVSDHAVYVGLWDSIPMHPKILFDHINYTNDQTSGWGRFLKLLGNNNTWKDDDLYGTDNFVFIEDSSFVWIGASSINGAVTDTEHGARLVIRHNIISGGGVQVHDTGSTPAAKGQRATEIYNNTFSCPIAGCSNIPGIGLRGGGWLVYNNNFSSGYWVPAFPQIYRATVSPGFIGTQCNGSTISACDTPNLYHCSLGDHAPCGYPGDWTCTGKGVCQIAASSPSDCPIGYPFIPNLDRVDGGNGSSGYPCRNQTGWGKEIMGGQREEPSPVYWWNNKLDGANLTFSFDVSPWFLNNRDYCNHDPASICGAKSAWPYTPYTYPHPWQSETTSTTATLVLKAPVNLRMVN